MSFEKFTKIRVTRGNPEPIATLWKSGRLGFNVKAVELFRIKNFTYAEIYFDSETNEAGVKFLTEKGEDTLKIIHNISGSDVSFISFARHRGLDLSQKRYYKLRWDAGYGMVVFSLNQ